MRLKSKVVNLGIKDSEVTYLASIDALSKLYSVCYEYKYSRDIHLHVYSLLSLILVQDMSCLLYLCTTRNIIVTEFLYLIPTNGSLSKINFDSLLQVIQIHAQIVPCQLQ